MKKVYEAFTDGAYSPLMKQGGIGIIIMCNDKKILEYSNMHKASSNNQMELGATIVALRFFKRKVDSIIIYTDSMYVIGCGVLGWKRTKNKKLWEEFDKQYKRVKELCPDIQFKHVPGHSGIELNEEVDKLAVAASQRI